MEAWLACSLQSETYKKLEFKETCLKVFPPRAHTQKRLDIKEALLWSSLACTSPNTYTWLSNTAGKRGKNIQNSIVSSRLIKPWVKSTHIRARLLKVLIICFTGNFAQSYLNSLTLHVRFSHNFSFARHLLIFVPMAFHIITCVCVLRGISVQALPECSCFSNHESIYSRMKQSEVLENWRAGVWTNLIILRF